LKTIRAPRRALQCAADADAVGISRQRARRFYSMAAAVTGNWTHTERVNTHPAVLGVFA
jgi:hypothetical protein